MAEQKTVVPFTWERPTRKMGYSASCIKQARWYQDGFELVARIDYDYDHDWAQDRGTFTDTWQEGAVQNPNYRTEGHRVFRWFMPDNTEAEQVKDLQKSGYSKGVAREMARTYVLEDLKIAIDGGDLIAVYVIVSVLFRGVELAHESLWGIEVSDSDDACLDECTLEVAYEAVDQANKVLAKLRAPEGE